MQSTDREIQYAKKHLDWLVGFMTVRYPLVYHFLRRSLPSEERLPLHTGRDQEHSFGERHSIHERLSE
jgi:hypothetical protein